MGTKSAYTAGIAAGSGTAAAIAASGGKARLRVVHNVAHGPDIDGYLDGVEVLRHFSYKSISDYLEVNAGLRDLAIKAAGTQTVVIAGSVELQAGRAYTLIVHGSMSPRVLTPLLLEDNLSCPAAGKSHVRFIHAAAGAPAVDIYAGPTKVFGNVSYGQVGTPHYLPVDAGVINVSVNPAGSGRPVLGPIPLKVDSGRIYTIIASGIVGDSQAPITALISEDSKGACVVMNI